MIVVGGRARAGRVFSQGAPENLTGLAFPSNGGVQSDSQSTRFAFTGAALLDRAPATYIHKLMPAQNTGYYTTFFWGPNDGLLPGNNYYGAHPYPPEGSTGTEHNWEVAADGLDTIVDDNGNDTTVIKGQWYTQAVVVRVVNTDDLEIKFYWDLDRDTERVITKTTVNNNAVAQVDEPALIYGDAPWNPNRELLSGVLRGLQIYDAQLSLAEIRSEITTPGSTPWYLNINPTPDDITDKSGSGHDPAWHNANRPTLWEG